MPFQGRFLTHRLGLDTINQRTKFEVSTRYEDMKGNENCRNGGGLVEYGVAQGYRQHSHSITFNMTSYPTLIETISCTIFELERYLLKVAYFNLHIVCVILSLAILIQYRIDTHTHAHRHMMMAYRASIASQGENWSCDPFRNGLSWVCRD